MHVWPLERRVEDRCARVHHTVLSPMGSILAFLLIERVRTGFYEVASCMNAVVAGLVGITGPCGVVVNQIDTSYD